ncbi:hypothetical protein NXS19_010287 [Fusarium pseudograminearum]|nr:hypothetical protein NXS19_010287 [Fusarium pseudograminearum]
MCTPTSEGRTGRVTPSAALMCMHIVFVVARPTDASSMNGFLADCLAMRIKLYHAKENGCNASEAPFGHPEDATHLMRELS